jgi:uncharacterized protein YgiB involved in biofilm formation
MKRSTQIGLAAAGVVLVATVWSLSGDDTPNEDLVYNSLAECRQANQLSAQACETAFADASAKRLSEAPKFQRQAECEQQFGAGSCNSATINGAQYFLPALAGFMLARNLTGIGHRPAAPLLPPTQAACPPGSRVPGSGRPECEQPRSAASSSSSSSGSSSSYGGSRRYSTTSGSNISATSSSVASRAAQSASSRGGFGSTARSFSSSSSS